MREEAHERLRGVYKDRGGAMRGFANGAGQGSAIGIPNQTQLPHGSDAVNIDPSKRYVLVVEDNKMIYSIIEIQLE